MRIRPGTDEELRDAFRTAAFARACRRRMSGAGLLRRSRNGGGRGGRGGRPPLLRLSDGTISRGSAAWWTSDDDLAVYSAPSGVLRRSGQWSVLEGAVENLCGGDPTDITVGSGNWSANGGATSDDNVAVAPDGTTTASRLNFASGATSGAFSGSDTVPGASATVRASVWARSESGTVDFRLAYYDGVTVQYSAHTATTTWQRFTATFTVDPVPTAGQVRIVNKAAGGVASILAWGADVQQDAANLLVSPVLAASSTRAADDLSFAGGDIDPDFGSVGFWFRFRPYHDNAGHVADGASRFPLFKGSNNFLAMNNALTTFNFRGGGVTVTSAAKTWSVRQLLTIAVDFVNMQVRFSGFTTGDETLDISTATDWSAASATTLFVGNNNTGTSPIQGEMTDIYPLATSPI